MLLALFPVVGCLSRRGNPGRDHVGTLTENNKQVTAVLSTLKDHGGQEQDIQTTQLSINPVFERQDLNDTHPPKIDGCRVQNGLSARLARRILPVEAKVSPESLSVMKSPRNRCKNSYHASSKEGFQ